jgi:hypothetical protein
VFSSKRYTSLLQGLIVALKDRVRTYETRLQEIRDKLSLVPPEEWVTHPNDTTIHDEQSIFSSCHNFDDFNVEIMAIAEEETSIIQTIAHDKLNFTLLSTPQKECLKRLYLRTNVLVNDLPNTGKTVPILLLKSSPRMAQIYSKAILLVQHSAKIPKTLEMLQALGQQAHVLERCPASIAKLRQNLDGYVLLPSDKSLGSFLGHLDVLKSSLSLVAFSDSTPSDTLLTLLSILRKSSLSMPALACLTTSASSSLQTMCKLLSVPPQSMITPTTDTLCSLIPPISTCTTEPKYLLPFSLCKSCKTNVVCISSESGKKSAPGQTGIYEACLEQGIKLISGVSSKEESGIAGLSRSQSQFGASQSELPSTFQLQLVTPPERHMTASSPEVTRFILNSPKSWEDLLNLITFTKSRIPQVVCAVQKDYTARRSNLLSEFIDPVGLIRMLRNFKKYSKGADLVKLNVNECLTTLGTNKKSSLQWVLKELQAMGVLSMFSYIPTVIHVEIFGANSNKHNDEFVRRLATQGQFLAGKYKINCASFAGLSYSLQQKLNDNKTISFPEELNSLSSNIDSFMDDLSLRKTKGMLSFEVREESLFVTMDTNLVEPEILRLVQQRSTFESQSVEKLDLLYGCLFAGPASTIDNLHPGSASGNKNMIQLAILSFFGDTKMNSSSILTNYSDMLPLKFKFNLREKTSLVQDLVNLLRGEKGLVKNILSYASKLPEQLKRRSIAIFVCKQIYLQATSSLRTVKSNLGVIQKFLQCDYMTVIQIIENNYNQFGFES